MLVSLFWGCQGFRRQCIGKLIAGDHTPLPKPSFLLVYSKVISSALQSGEDTPMEWLYEGIKLSSYWPTPAQNPAVCQYSLYLLGEPSTESYCPEKEEEAIFDMTRL